MFGFLPRFYTKFPLSLYLESVSSLIHKKEDNQPIKCSLHRKDEIHLIMEDIKKYLQQILTKIDGLHYIQISDKDGVTFLKISANNAPDFGSRLHLLSNFGIVAEQSGKLGVGRTNSLTAIYSNYQVIQIFSLPLVITFIANATANTGYIHGLERQLTPLLNDFKEIMMERHIELK